MVSERRESKFSVSLQKNEKNIDKLARAVLTDLFSDRKT